MVTDFWNNEYQIKVQAFLGVWAAMLPQEMFWMLTL